MNSQDITRALIDTTVARAMVEMDADPKRSVRKLCDLGRQFSRGRFQNQIFAIFQDLLRNDESPYYQAIDFLPIRRDFRRRMPISRLETRCSKSANGSNHSSRSAAKTGRRTMWRCCAKTQREKSALIRALENAFIWKKTSSITRHRCFRFVP